MRIADLLFIVALLTTFVAVAGSGILALQRRGRESVRMLRRTGIFVVVYLLLVLGTSLATPREWIAIGEEQRFDDWALTVVGVVHNKARYHVQIRVANHARVRSQRAADADLVLVASDGKRFQTIEAPDERSLTSMLRPGESFETTREFDVPTGTDVIGIDVIHGAWPEWFIIGDRGSLLHKRPLVRIE